MNKNRKSQGRVAKTPVLSSVGLAVLATLMAGGAHAADTNITAGPVATTTGYQTVQSVQGNAAPLTATASGNTGGITVNGTSQSGTTSTATQNAVRASATGNSFSNAIDLQLTAANPDALPVDGAASLGSSVNSGVIKSVADNNKLNVNLNGFSSGGAANTDNVISASTTLNSGTSLISGTVPNDYSSTASGSTAVGFSPASSTVSAQGSIVSTTVQQGTGAASSASASGNTVGLNLTAVGANQVNSAPALDNNTVSATLKGNAATSTVDIQAGGAPTFAGSAVVSNLQVNLATDAPVTHTATNAGSSVAATINSPTGVGANTLAGALSVQGNTLSSAATGNESLGAAGVAGNRILLGDGVAVNGSGGPTANTNTYAAGALTANVAADLAIYNSQGNVGVSLGSTTSGASVSAAVQSIDGGTATLANNGVTSSAIGNAASSAIASGQNGATFAATTAVGNQQVNSGGGVTAITSDSLIGVVTGQADGATNQSTVAVTGNRTAATGYGNSINQSIALQANALPLGGTAVLTGSRTPDGTVSANGAATLTNLQGNYNSAVTASNNGSAVGAVVDSHGIAGDTIKSSTVSVGGNTQESVALGNSASSALSLAGTTVGSGAGIASVQIGDASSPVSASLTDSTASLYAGTHVSDSTLSLTSNLQRAIGYGNSAANSLQVSANSADVTPSVLPASQVNLVASPTGTVTAAYGVLNNQSALGDVSATASGATAPVSALTVLVEGRVNGSAVSNAGNALVAAAYANDATSAATLALGTGVTTTGFSSVGNVTNVQAVTGADVLATATGGNVVTTRIDRDVSASTVDTSANQIQALAYGNRSTGNTLDVSGNTLDTASATARVAATVIGSTAITDAAFSVQNAQSGSGTVTATQRDGVAGTAASVLASIGGAITNSTVTANNNASSASATSNSASNGLTLAGNDLSTSSALQNVQTTSASVNALIGKAGVAGSTGTLADTFNFSATGTALAGNSVGGNTTLTGGTLTVSTAGLTQSQIDYLTGHGWSVVGGNVTGPATVLGTISGTAYLALVNGQSASLSATVPGTPATAAIPNQGGVTIAAGAGVSGSNLTVSGNTTNGATTGNSASNTVAVNGNSIGAGSGNTTGIASVALGTAVTAQADNVLSNVQQVTGPSALTSNVYGTFAIDTQPAAAITGSTLSVSGNSQRASAVANTAANGLSVTGTNLQATSALVSQQSSAASVAAGSNLDLYAPGAVNKSSVDLSGNQNVSLGVINDVTNALTVNAANVSPVGAVANAQLAPTIANGDHVLNNNQLASTSASSTATTSLYNQDRTAAATTGLANSTVTITGNATTAEASANRADNAVALNGAALQSANAGLVNTQSSSAGVTALATISAAFDLADTATPSAAAALNSGITIDGNSTTALARGNAASNALNVAAGSSYGVSTALTAGSSTVDGTQATAALLNTQSNSGNVSATGAGSYQVALNSLSAGTVAGVTNGTVAVTGNTVNAAAYGNSATNAVTVAGGSAGRPTAAVGNYQVNSGAIVATASSVNYGVNIAGTVSNSTLRAAGNQVTATAVGNSAVSTIASAR